MTICDGGAGVGAGVGADVGAGLGAGVGATSVAAHVELVHNFIFRRQPWPLMWLCWSSSSQSVQRCLPLRWHMLMAVARGTKPLSPKRKRTWPAVTLEVSVVVVAVVVVALVVVVGVAVGVVVACGAVKVSAMLTA